MSRILHLSDLHLSGSGEPLEDLKEKVLRAGEETTTEAVLWHTAKALGELADVDAFDAIVVSGDITQAGAQEGFDAFDDFLNLLGISDPQRIESSLFQETMTLSGRGHQARRNGMQDSSVPLERRAM